MTTRIADAVAAALGEDALLEGRRAVHDVEPAASVAPRDTEAVATLLALCAREGWPVEVTGGTGAPIAWGRPPARVDVLLSTERLRGVTEYEPADVTVGVRAGTAVTQLAVTVDAYAQRLPFDGAAGSTVGGAIARRATGPRAAGAGTPRRHTLGMELVTGDGRVLRPGGRVVKNVAGYDLVRLVVGSRGALGVVTHAWLRLAPRPDRSRAFEMRSEGRNALLELAHRLRAAAAEPAALELEGPEWRLLALWDGTEEVVDAGADAAHAVAAASGARVAEIAPGAVERDPDAAVVIVVEGTPSSLVRRLDALGSREGAGIRAGIADGVVVVTMAQAPGAGWLEAMRGRLAQLGAVASVERAPAGFLRDVTPYPDAGPALGLMRRLKAAFDPANVLQPGRWVV